MRYLIPLLLCLLGLPVHVQAIDVGAMPACAGYDSDLGGCPVYVKGVCKAMAADGVISDNAGILQAIYIAAAEAGDDFLIYDNPSAASGTVIFNQTNLAAGDKPFPNVPATYSTGAYLDVTAADASIAFTVTVCYSE